MVVYTRRNSCEIGVAKRPRPIARIWLVFAPKVLALAFLAALGLAGPLFAAEDGFYPVWWSGKLELESLDQVDQRLRRDLWPDIPEGLKLYKKQGDGHVTAQARNCESLIRLSEEGYYGGGSPDIYVQYYQLSVCQAVALLGQAKPARVSYLRDFVPNKDAVNYLPAMVNIYASCRVVCRAYYANKRGVPLAKFDEVEDFKITDKNSLIVWTGAWRIEMTFIARGDFTSDDLDDLLLLSSGGATEGTLGGAELYLLTRDKPGAVLRVIDADKHLCPDYSGCP